MITFARKFIKYHFSYAVSRQSSSLAYYLMFSLFPFLIFLNSILAIIDIPISQVEYYIQILPEDIQAIIIEYLRQLSTSGNIIPLIGGLGLTLYSFTKCVNSLTVSMNSIYDTKGKKSLILSFYFTVSLMLSVYLLLFLFISGGTILSFVGRYIHVTENFEDLFNSLRYVVAMGYFFIVILMLYKLMPKVRLSIKDVLPGSIYAVFGLYLFSMIFSFYVENFSNYSVIYGSLSAIMILMLWLYLSGAVIIQGSIINKMIINKEWIKND